MVSCPWSLSPWPRGSSGSCEHCGREGQRQRAPGNASLPAQQLFAEERWPEVIRAVEARPGAPLIWIITTEARSPRWGVLKEAREAFLAGYRLQPRDKRFAVELGGIEFLNKQYCEGCALASHRLTKLARRRLRERLLRQRLLPARNLEAALKYWNRVDKPRIESVRSEPALKVNPVLLDRALAFAPASTLRLPELLTTESRLQSMDYFQPTISRCRHGRTRSSM